MIRTAVRSVVAVVLVAGLVGATGRGGDPRPEAVPPPPKAPLEASAPPSAPLAAQRVLLIGDGLLAAAADRIGARLDEAGASHRIETVDGAGLLNPEVVDWKARATELVTIGRPTQVVVALCCTYPSSFVVGEDGTPLRPGTPEFEARWTTAANDLAATLTAGGARLFWVVAPSSPPPPAAGVDVINALTLASADRAEPPVRLIRWDGAVPSGPQAFLADPTSTGRSRLTDAAADQAAEATVDALVADRIGSWGPFPSPEELALQLRRDLVGGPDDRAAADRTGARLFNGPVAPTDLARDLAFGPTWGEPASPLIRLHLAVTGRPPPDGWLRPAVQRAREGATVADEAAMLLGRDSVGTGALTDAELVDQLLTNTFGRAPTPAERARWLDQLGDGGSRAVVLAGIATDAATVADSRVRGWVDTTVAIVGLLHRAPTEDEVGRWAPEVAAGRSDALVTEILDGDEYAARVPATRDRLVGQGVVGGTPLGEGAAPWLAALVTHRAPPATGTFCAAALIDPNWVVTTAGCVAGRPAGSIDVVLGRFGTSRRTTETIPVSWVVVDAGSDPASRHGDLALLRLKRRTDLEPIALAADDVRLRSPRLFGWTVRPTGRAGPAEVAHLDGLDDADCAAAHGPAFHPDTMVCAGTAAGGADTCQGGAPLVVGNGRDRRLLGLMSWGVGCGEPGRPAVATRVAAFRAQLDLDRHHVPFTSSAQAVAAVFRGVLDRPPTDFEARDWRKRLDRQLVTTTDMVFALARGSESDAGRGPLIRFWVAAGGAVPPAADVERWAEAGRTGDPPTLALIEEAATRPELAAELAEGDEATFAAKAYERIFGTDPEPEVLRDAVTRLTTGGVPRWAMMASWASDGRTRLRAASDAVMVVPAITGRYIVEEELVVWMEVAAGGTPIESLVRALLLGSETVDRY